MAEFAVVAQPHNGYQRLDVLEVLPDGAVWGRLDLADVASGKLWILKVPGVGLSIARQAVRELWEPALPNDAELGAPDIADRRIRRGRRAVRAFVDELPPPLRDELANGGIVTLSLMQAQSIVRKMVWQRGSGQILDTGIGEFG